MIEFVNNTLKALKPELRVAQLTPLTLTVLGHPHQTYQILSSQDLVTWTSVQTITATANWTDVVDPQGGLLQASFYKVTWLSP